MVEYARLTKQSAKNLSRNLRFRTLGTSVGILALLLTPAVAYLQTDAVTVTTDPTLLQAPVLPPDPAGLEAQISYKRAQVDELQRKLDAYQKNLNFASAKRVDLQSDLESLSGQMEAVSLKLEGTQAQVDLTELQVAKVQADIATKEGERAQTLVHLGALIRTLHSSEQVSPLTMTLSSDSLSDFFRQLSAGSEIYDDLRQTLAAVHAAQDQLDLDRDALAGQLAQLTQIRDQQRTLQDTLAQQEGYKNALLSKTRASESQLTDLVESVRQEAQSINADIQALEIKARQTADPLELGTGIFRWPVEPNKGISAYFHDPSYPFRCTASNPSNCIGEHNAIDIPTPQGTPIHSADDGYVAIASKLDWVLNSGGKILYPAYNYVLLVHTNGMSTVYGHLSRVLVNVGQYVQKGDIIGASGATPGTAGAGRWTTGPHLHFEVRVNGIPDDPLRYLP